MLPEVLEAMFGGPATRAYTEVDVVTKAGRADLGIRSTVADPLTPTVNKGQATVDILRSPEGNNPGVSVGVGVRVSALNQRLCRAFRLCHK